MAAPTLWRTAGSRHYRKYMSWLLGALERSAIVVLVGSWARGQARREQSDLDILVIGGGDQARNLALHSPADVQVIALSADDFQRRLFQGDDFPQWALRFGVPVNRKSEWEVFRQNLLTAAPWPNYRQKCEQALSKEAVARDLLRMGDVVAAAEEATLAVSHVARCMLLRRNVFPLSRPELARQLRTIGEHQLADSVDLMVRHSDLDSGDIGSILRIVRDTANGAMT
jgi:hypothetical protein